jgi:hypothetical protein
MITVAEILLQDGADALRSRVMSISELSPSDRAFLAWILHEDTPRDDLAVLAATAAINFSTTRSYHDLATMGYAAHASGLTDVQRLSLLEQLVGQGRSQPVGAGARIALQQQYAIDDFAGAVPLRRAEGGNSAVSAELGSRRWRIYSP